MSISKSKRLFVFERDGMQCRFCGTIHNLTIDHVRPTSKGGSDSVDNLQTLCQKCNTAKGNIINYNPNNPSGNRKKKTLGFVDNPVKPTGHISHTAESLPALKVLGKIDVPPGKTRRRKEKVKKAGKFPSAFNVSEKNSGDVNQGMTYKMFDSKLKKKYPHAYSMIDGYMWSWIFDNIIKK